MRFFIAKNGSTVVDKQAAAGNDKDIDVLVARYKTAHPALTVEELDETAFNAAVMVQPLTARQQAWATFKAGSPSAAQAITFLAKEIGLE